MLPLHGFIKARALDHCAYFLSRDLLEESLSSRLQFALKKFAGQSFPITIGQFNLAIRCEGHTYQPGAWVFDILPGLPTQQIFQASTKKSFVVRFEIHAPGDNTQVLFKVALEAKEVAALVDVTAEIISFNSPSATYQTLATRPADSEAVRQSLGMSEIEQNRAEGMIEGAVVPRIFQTVIDGAPPYELKTIFPAVRLNNPISIEFVNEGLVVIGGEGFQLDESQRCECSGEAPPIELAQGAAAKTVTTPDDAYTQVPIDVAFPAPPNVAVEKLGPVRAAIYLPEKTMRAITEGPYPSASGSVYDNGFIGWRVDYSLGFKDVDLRFDDIRAPGLLDIALRLNMQATLNMDLPCIGRRTIGIISAENVSTGKSNAEIGLNFLISPDGKLVIDPFLLNLKLAPFNIYVVAFTAWLSFFGPIGSLVGFFIDVILTLVLKFNLPLKLRAELKKVVASNSWTLLDLSGFRDWPSPLDDAIIISRDDNSFLVGAGEHKGRDKVVPAKS